MDNFILYLLKVSAGVFLLYASYILFFSKETFYQRNRFLLLTTILIPFIIPMLDFSRPVANTFPSDSSIVVNGLFTTRGMIEEAVYQKVNSFDFQKLITWIYFSVTGILLLRLITGIIRTLFIIRKGTTTGNGWPKIVLSADDHPPFSFFPFIVIPEKIYESGNCSQILSHEKAHVTQGHTFDLLITELVIAFLWFNPFVWLARRSIILNHEFIADSISIRKTHDAKEYQYNLLNLQMSIANTRFAHSFSRHIKNRIVMINKIPTRNYAILKSIIIVPVVAILFALFSFKPESRTDSIADQTSKFSAASKNSIFAFLTETLEYPSEAINNNDIDKSSSKPESRVESIANQTPMFSETSKASILNFISKIIVYPSEAISNNDTATIFIDIQMKKGGTIKNINTYTEKKGIKTPIMDEIVVVGYTNNVKNASKDYKLLREECIRIANKLSNINVPEWMEKDMEFVIPVKFKLYRDVID